MKSTFAALWLISAILSVRSFPVENYGLDYSLVEEGFSAELNKRTNPPTPHTPSQFHAPSNTCPANQPVIWVNQNSRSVTIDVGVQRQGLSGYFTVVVDPVAHTARTAGVEFYGEGVHISPAWTVTARTVPAPLPRDRPVGPHDTFLQVDIRSVAHNTPNGADNGLDYWWRGATPGFVMRITQESYRGRLHQSWRIRWDRLLHSAIAVFLVPVNNRHCAAGQRP